MGSASAHTQRFTPMDSGIPNMQQQMIQQQQMFQQQQMMLQQQHMNEMMLFQQQQRQLTGSDFMQPINTASNQNLTNNYQIGNLNLTQNKRQIKKDA